MSRISEKPALELCDEAVFLLRRAPLDAWTIYLLGVGPFLVGLLYFWTDMTRGAPSEQRLVSGAFSLTILFIWMKTCQSIFTARLWSVVSGIPRPLPAVREWFRIALAQTRIHPWGMFLIPMAMIFAIPFAWVYAYFQNATVVGAAPAGETVHNISLKQAALWPRQNHIGILSVSALGAIVCVDLLIFLFLAPQLLITFFGVKELFHPNAWLLANTTFLALLFSFSYLLVDPLVKSFYTLRCFYGQSLATGEDLQARLVSARAARPAPALRLAKAVAILVFALFSTQGAEAIEPLTPAQLNESISQTLKSEEYNWRFPREITETKKGRWLNQFFTSIGKWIVGVLEKVFDWIGRIIGDLLRRFFTPSASPPSPGDTAWPSLKKQLLVITILAAFVLAYVFLKRWRRRAVAAKPAVRAAAAIPDLNREDVAADELPEDQWLALATKLAGEGELRLAIRALFLSALATMASRQWVALARFKSNSDYERELRRRAASVPQAPNAFSALTKIYNRIWYGLHEPSPELLAQCRENLETLKS